MEYIAFKEALHEGLEFQKAKGTSKILKIDENGVRYSIGKNGSAKKVTFAEFQAAFDELQENGSITRNWYKQTFPAQARAASCNFTTIGGLFQHFSFASYRTGTYIRREG